MNYIELTREKLSVEAISNLVVHESCGAISVFAGCTRDNFQDKIVQSLEYEAYEPMAVKHMEMISNSIRERWNDVVNIAMFHRLGLVPVREFSVVIAISSPHRKSSLEAVSYAIDELKKTVPIWKKEKYEGDQSTWKENKESGKCCKRLKLNFPLCAVVEEDSVPRNLIQIAADENEVKRRIQCFIEKKREEIDLNNIMDFTAAKRLSGDEESIEDTSSCARTNSVVVKQEGSKCHLRVSRVKNGIGPQIRPDYLHTLDKLMSANPTTGIAHIKQEPPAELEQEKDSGVRKLPFGFYSRLSDVEEHLNIKAVNTKQIHERLKAIEDRLLHLESISPEYKHFLRLPSSRSSSPQRTVLTKLETKCPPEKKIYSVNELDAIIEKMKQSNS